MANIGTSTVAYATQQPTGSLVFLASDGTACVLFSDGTNQVVAYSAPPYSSWASATLVTGQYMALAGRMRGENIDTVTGATSTVRPNYRLLTKSGSAWTVGSATVISTTAAGTVSVGNVMQYCGQDPQGRHWIICGGASTYTTSRALYSPANTPTGSWTQSVSTTQTGDQWLPCGDIVGNYLVKTYWNGTAIQYHRLDVSGASLGAWSTAATLPNLGGSPNGSSHLDFEWIGGTKAVLAYSTGSGIYAQLYDSATDTWGTATQLSTTANDRHPSIATDDAGNAYVVWCSYVASNNYALVTKKYNGTTWAGSPTTLVASGTNIANPNAGYAAQTLAVIYTQGTASPYTVGWVPLAFGGTRSVPTSASVEGPGPLTLYGSAVAHGTLVNAGQLSNVTGGSETTKVSTFTGASYYGEIWAQGGSPASSASVGSPDGRGWAYQPGAGTFAAGNWSASLAYLTSNAYGMSDDMTLRVYKYPGYSLIATLTVSFTSASSRTVLTCTPGAGAETAFTATDLLYFDLWVHDVSGVTSEAWTIYESSSGTAGVANDFQITTPRFTAAISGGSNTVPASVALLLEKKREPGASAALGLLAQANTVPASSSVSFSFVNDIPASGALLSEKTHIAGSSAALLLEKTRPVGMSTPLLGEKTRTLTTVASALLLEKTRTVGATASLLRPATGEYATVVLADTPLRYYRLDEENGTVAFDQGAGGYHGALHGGITLGSPGLLAEDTNTAQLFDGSTGSIDAATTGLPAGAAAFSIECWVTLSSLPAGTWPDALMLGTQASSQTVGLMYNGGDTALVLTTAAADIWLPGTPLTNTPYHLVGTYDGATLAFYVNGVSVGTPLSTTLTITYGVFQIGALYDKWPGSIDEVAIYPAALSPAQVMTHYITGIRHRAITPVTSPLLLEKSRAVASTGALSLEGARTIPLTGAVLVQKDTTSPASGALLSEKTRTVGSLAAFLVEKSRTVTTAASLLSEKSRTVSAETALSQLGTLARSMPASTALLSTSTRSLDSSAALGLLSRTRAVPASAAFSLVEQVRTVPASVALSLMKTRTLTASTPLSREGQSRMLASTSAVLQATSTRSSTASVALSRVQTRSVTADASLSQVGTLFRSVPIAASVYETRRMVSATVALSLVSSRTIPPTVPVQATRPRSLAASTAVQETRSQSVTAASIALSQARTRILTSPSACLLSRSTREIQASAVVHTTETRESQTWASLLETRRRQSGASGALLTQNTKRTLTSSVSLVIPIEGVQVFAPASACLSATTTRFVACAVVLLASNARVLMRSGKASMHLPGGKATVTLRSGKARVKVP